jgi:serine/threonine-protein kinase
MSFDPTRWPEVTNQFGALLALTPADRASRLNALDEALRRELISLLDAHERADARFGRPATGAVRVSPSGIGDLVGQWRLVSLIGVGGMGTVFEARRETEHFMQRAALKMLSRVADTPVLREQFDAERRIVARLQHRNVASLLDGGVDADGRPWFAMEYVDGERLDQWCTMHALDERARVQLMRQACNAVQHAHEHRVIHGDIKPANLLVAGDGTLKLVDFGIATTALDEAGEQRAATGLPVAVGARAMTAAYASPEQRAGAVLTTATDVWSLGVVLYELLTDTRPTTAERGWLGRGGRARVVSADLEAIVRRATSVEATDRYASARELGDDLQRWLDGRVVRARPDTIAYRGQTFVKRNPLATAGIAVAVTALIVAAIVSVRQTSVARGERDVARREQARAEAVQQFLERMVAGAAPREGGRDLTLMDAIDRAVPALDSAFAGSPDARAAAQLSIGNTLQELQQNERARPLLEAAYAHFRSHDGPVPSRAQRDALWNLAALAASDGRIPTAESLFVRLSGLYAASPDAGRNDVTQALLRVAALRTDAGDLPAAIAGFDSLIPRHQMVSRTDSIDHAAWLGSRGVALATHGDFVRAERDLSRSIALSDRVLGPDNFASAQTLQPYASVLLFSDSIALAERIARRAVEGSRRAYGDSAAVTIGAERMLGTVLVAAGRCSEARAVFDTILSHLGPSLGASDVSVGYVLAHRGFCRARDGEGAAAVADARTGLRITRAAAGERHYVTGLAASLAGATLASVPSARRQEAESLLVAGVSVLRESLAPGHPRVRDAEARLSAFRAGRPILR